MTRNVPSNSILPNKSQPFSIVWADDTDTICDLSCLLTLIWTTLRAKDTKLTQHDPRRPEEAFVVLLMVRQPLPPSHLPPLFHSLLSFPAMLLRLHLLLLQESLRAFTLALVDSLTRSGSFAFLGDFFATERLFELRDFRIARVMPKGEDLVLDLADNVHTAAN
jgi:hypothetical protein